MARARVVGGGSVSVETRNKIERLTKGPSAVAPDSEAVALGRVFGGVSHKLNNILTVIQNIAQMAREDAPADGMLADDLREILEAAATAGELSRQLLDFSRGLHATIETVEVAEFVAGMRGPLNRVAGLAVPSVLTLAPYLKDARVEFDATVLEQVIVNLALWQRDRTGGGGLIECVAGPVASDGVTKTMALRARCDRAPFSASERAHYEAFEAGKAATTEAPTLNFIALLALISPCGGTLALAADGNSVSAFIPHTPVSSTYPGPSPAPPRPRRMGVLLVEPHDGIRVRLTKLLEVTGYRVMAAADGIEARDHLEPSGFEPGLVIVDTLLSNQSAPDLVAALHQRWADLPVIYLSGVPIDALGPDRTPPVGAIVLQKPFAFERLLAEVDRFIGL